MGIHCEISIFISLLFISFIIFLGFSLSYLFIFLSSSLVSRLFKFVKYFYFYFKETKIPQWQFKINL